jgi:hypothetical protein
MGRLILLLSVIVVLWAAGMPLHWIAFLLGVSLLTIIIWCAVLRRRRGRIVGRTYHMKIDGEPIEDDEGVDRRPIRDSTVTGVMVEEYSNGDVKAFTIDRKIFLVPMDPMVVDVLPCDNVFRTGPHIGRTRVAIVSKYARHDPILPHRAIIAVFSVRVVPGPPFRVVIQASGRPQPAQRMDDATEEGPRYRGPSSASRSDGSKSGTVPYGN